MWKILKYSIFLVVLSLLAFGGGYYYIQKKYALPYYPTVPALKKDMTQTVFAVGDVVSSGEMDLSFKTDGRIILMGVKVGDRVVTGQKIAEIDTGTLKQQIQQATASIAFQSRTLEDMQLYKNKKIFSKEQREAQKANVDNARFALSVLEEELKNTVLYAVKDGIITKKYFDTGESVSANQVVVSLSGEKDLEVRARVPEAAINKVVVGQEAVATFDALPEERIKLRVLEIEPNATILQGNHYYLVKLALPNQDSRIRNGMSPDIHIATAMRKDVLVLPVSALKGGVGKRHVDVLQPDRQSVRSVDIVTGLRGDGGMIEIVSGVSAGDQIVL
ncbi:MAG: efflux RND transporter periplasmic adaptor subunit [Candidatus Moraniibacteriota bacterium]